ncbi:MAG: hypothetical protein NVV68_11120 [Dokdonella sp.]|nr:hypothetical protein [Dokdonella sp.]
MADALALLGVEYGSEAGCRQAAEIARLLAQASLEAGVRLACDRGADGGDAALPLERARRRGLPPELVHDLARHGVRYGALTAITAQPRLSLLANNVSDALDPLPDPRPSHAGAAARAPVSRRLRAQPAPRTGRAVDERVRDACRVVAGRAAGDARRGAAVDRRADRRSAGAARQGRPCAIGGDARAVGAPASDRVDLRRVGPLRSMRD